MPNLKRKRSGGAANPDAGYVLTNGDKVTLYGQKFTAQTPAGSRYSILHNPATLETEFQRRAGETRAELAANDPRMAIGAGPYRIVWSFTPWAAGDGAWNAIGQIHGLNDVLGRNAIIALFYESGHAISRLRKTNEAGVVQASEDVDHGVLTLGQRYSVDWTFKQHATDGVAIAKFGLYGQTLTTIFNKTSERIGYPDEEVGQPSDNGPYFKFGIYGDTANTLPVRVSYFNLSYGLD